MSSTQPKLPSSALQQGRSSFDPNDYPMPVLKTKKSKFAENAETDFARTQR